MPGVPDNGRLHDKERLVSDFESAVKQRDLRRGSRRWTITILITTISTTRNQTKTKKEDDDHDDDDNKHTTLTRKPKYNYNNDYKTITFLKI